MRQFFLVLLTASLFAGPLSGYTGRRPSFKKQGCLQVSHGAAPSKPWFLELKAGYYYPTTSIMRDIFGGGFSFRVESDYEFFKPLALWTDAGLYWKTGQAVGGPEKTVIKLPSFSAGLKTTFYLHRQFAFYLGAAPRLFVLFLTNDSPYVKKHTNKVGIGGGFISGFWIVPSTKYGLYFDVFLDYSVKKFHFGSNGKASLVFDFKIDGLLAGLGAGYKF